MANPSLQIGNGKWAIKEDNLLGYSTAGSRFVPQPITMTRATLGTRVNPEGLVEDVELLGSENIDLSSFVSATNWDIDGSEIKASGTTALFKQPFTLGAGKTFKITIVVDSITSGDFEFWIGGYSNDTPTISIADTYTYYVTSGGSELYMGFNPHSNLIATISSVSVKEATINNLPRVDYTDGTSSLLVEPQRTNLITYSEDFSQSYWTKQSGVTPTYNTTETLSPDGTYNATKFIGNGSSGVLKSNINITGVVTRSVYLKSVTGTVNVVLKDPNQTITSKSLTVTTEWQRFDLTEDNTTSLQGIWIDDIPVSGIYMWGAQLEESYATSYIKTSGSTVTRNQEEYKKSGISDKINSEEGVLFVEFESLVDSNFSFISINDGTAAQNIAIGRENGSSNIYVVATNVSNQFYYNSSASSNTTNNNKIALKYKENDYALWINGTEVYTDTSASVPVELDTLSFDYGGGLHTFNGKVKQLQIFKTALTDEQLTSLTS